MSDAKNAVYPTGFKVRKVDFGRGPLIVMQFFDETGVPSKLVCWEPESAEQFAQRVLEKVEEESERPDKVPEGWKH